MGVASTTLSELAPEESVSAIDSWSTVLASSRLLLTLINNVLDLGKIEANKMQDIELSTVPVFSVIREGVEFCSLFAALSETEIVLDTDETDWTVKVNRTRLQQVRLAQFCDLTLYVKFYFTLATHHFYWDEDHGEFAVECNQVRARAADSRESSSMPSGRSVDGCSVCGVIRSKDHGK